VSSAIINPPIAAAPLSKSLGEKTDPIEKLTIEGFTSTGILMILQFLTYLPSL